MDGVTLTPLKHISVPHGDVYHAMKSTDPGFCGFGEAYFSEIEKGAVKGWKRHREMTLNIVVISGAIRFIVHDDMSGKTESVVLGPDVNYQRLTVAPGLWMAFEGIGAGKSLLLDIIPAPHNPEEADKAEISRFKIR